MSRSLLSRIEALEKSRGNRPEPIVIVFTCVDVDGTSEIAGYWWRGGQTMREPGESDEALLARAELEAMPALEPWGGLTLTDIIANEKKRP